MNFEAIRQGFEELDPRLHRALRQCLAQRFPGVFPEPTQYSNQGKETSASSYVTGYGDLILSLKRSDYWIGQPILLNRIIHPNQDVLIRQILPESDNGSVPFV